MPFSDQISVATQGRWRLVGRVNLAEVDPELLDGSGGHVPVPVFSLPPGPVTDPPETAADPGVVILKGALLSEVSVCGRVTAELAGRGDLVRFAADGAPSTLEVDQKHSVLQPMLVAAVEPLPALTARAAEQACRAGIQRAIASHTRVDVRLLAYLWFLADRFGTMTGSGVRVDLALTHAVLGRLIGARRPTVTTALQRLMALGYLEREKQIFVLHGGPEAIDELLEQRAD